jgi:sugar phosphate isomerase/epimerase
MNASSPRPSEAPISRRDMSRALGALGLGLAFGPHLAAGRQPGVPAAIRDGSAVEKLGWDLGCQAWTFRDRTCFEAIDTVKRLGLKNIELYPGQALSPDLKETKVGPPLSAGDLSALKAKLATAGVTARAFGVVTFTGKESECRPHFEFAKSLGIATITCEPEENAWDLVARLSDEYKINAACHDHPKPSRYWNPDLVLEAIKGRSQRVGFCADVGHWLRSGLVPVECLKKCEGRLISLHFKDVDATSPSKPDVPFGRGQCDIPGLMKELRRQRFKGTISIEHESGSGAAVERDVTECIAFVDRTAREIV